MANYREGLHIARFERGSLVLRFEQVEVRIKSLPLLSKGIKGDCHLGLS